MSSFVNRFGSEIRDEFNRSKNTLGIPYEEIVSATNNFAVENQLAAGSSSSGKWYRAQLPVALLESEEKTMIDILVRELKVTEDAYTEMAIAYYLKHENIGSLLYWTADTVNVFFVYKIEANGSLDEHLHSTAGLTWTQRLSICIGVGRALKYIHDSDFVQPGYYVIHGNIKSSLISLDDSWQPKLQGFELPDATVAQRNTLHLTGKYKGTLQYKDPAYEKSGALTAKSDVFSFGVVLFEVLFGRSASTPPNGDPQADDDWNFAEFARSRWKK
uniref:probable receptor-like protein kinase At2g23200 n=1 Tax=Erigeron canadensis TaxID=72917 RepID=UPI001CB9AF89|nr:probable receptor-like protein kinase At2g23200 [Erigeron canadensis]